MSYVQMLENIRPEEQKIKVEYKKSKALAKSYKLLILFSLSMILLTVLAVFLSLILNIEITKILILSLILSLPIEATLIISFIVENAKDNTENLARINTVFLKDADILDNDGNIEKIYVDGITDNLSGQGVKNLVTALLLCDDDMPIENLAEKLNINKKILLRDYIKISKKKADIKTVEYLKDGKNFVIAKGYLNKMLEKRNMIRKNEKDTVMTKRDKLQLISSGENLSKQGYDVISVSVGQSENTMVILGFVGVKISVKKTAKQQIVNLIKLGIKPIYSSNLSEDVASFIANELSIRQNKVISGEDIENFSKAELENAVVDCDVFINLKKVHRNKIEKILKTQGKIIPELEYEDLGNLLTQIISSRAMYENISKYLRFMLACKLSLQLLVVACVSFGMPPVLLPAQIVIIYIGFLILSIPLLVDNQRDNIKPKRELVIHGGMITSIIFRASGIALSALGGFVAVYSITELTTARSVSFGIMLCAMIILLFESKSEKLPIYNINILENKFMFITALIVGIAGLSILYTSSFGCVPITASKMVVSIAYLIISPVLGFTMIAIKE